MNINPGWDKDPLRKKKYHVIVQLDSGEFQHLSPKAIEEPIELLKLDVEKNHVVGLHEREMVITDAESGEVVARYESYKPEPQSPNEPITPYNAEVRDRWFVKMLNWLVPKELLDAEDTLENQAKIKEHLTTMGVEYAISPGGTQILFFRNGEPLAGWKAFV